MVEGRTVENEREFRNELTVSDPKNGNVEVY